MISFEDFKKIDLKVGEVKEVTDLEEANSLYKVIVDLGDEERQLLAGLKKYYEKEDLEGKQVVIVANLEPKSMFGEESQGMLLAVGDEARLLTVDEEVENGSEVS